MKILMTADTLGGVWTYATELCAALRPHGVQIALATLGRPLSRSQREDVSQLPNVHVYESRFRLEWMPSPWDSLAEAAGWLLSLERQVRPDVIHLNHLVHGDLPWNAPVLVAGHSCVFSWWKAVRGGKPGPEWTEYRNRVEASLQAANHVVAPSRAMLSALWHHYGPFRHSRVIPNARSAHKFWQGRKQPMILSAGRLWDDAKNVGTLCKTAHSLTWPVFVVGPCDGPDGQKQNLSGVTQVGELPSALLSRWLALASIYAAPARYEPFGLTALEAALSGCALVLGDIESQREVWGNSALYVDPGSTDHLRDVLNAVAHRPGVLPTLAKRARLRAERYNPQQFAASYRALYRSLNNTMEGSRCASYSSITH